MPIRTRLTLISTGLMALVLAAVGLFIYARLTTELTQAVDAGLRSRAEALIGAIPAGGALASPGSVIEADEAFAQLLTSDGTVVDASAGVENSRLLDEDQLNTLDNTLTYESTVATGEEDVPARLLAVRVDGEEIVVVGASLEDQHDALNRLALLLGVGGVAALALSALVGWLVAGAALRPVERMRQQASAFTAVDPSARLAVPSTGDELARLAQTLNEVLQRLEEALNRERQFVSDASHELRTPLANLQAEIEIALRRPRTTEGLRAALTSAGDETNRLIALAQDLLVLARGDQDQLPLAIESIDVVPLITQEVAGFAARQKAQGVTMRIDAPPSLQFGVDPVRLRQVLSNLLDNALRHSPAGGSVTVVATTSPSEPWLVISVSDEGAGFAADFLPRAMEPFSRVDEGRARSDGGAGLGLAIVRAIVTAHGGEVTVTNGDLGGGLVTLRLPPASPSH